MSVSKCEGGRERAEERKRKEWERGESVRSMHSSNSGNEDAHSFACHPLWLEKYRPDAFRGHSRSREGVRAGACIFEA